MLFLEAYSPTFRAKIAPNTKPNPQLKKETISVSKVTQAAAVEVLVHSRLALSMYLLIVLLNAKT